MKRILFYGLLIVLGLGALSKATLAADEATVKAAYIYNFAKFIQWPDEQRPTLRMCVIGTEAVGKTLSGLIGKSVRNMQIAVRHAVTLEDIPQCDLVFVTLGHAPALGRIRQLVAGYPIVVVSEGTDVLPSGAMLALILSNDKVVFEVDLTAARQLGLQISGKLLQLARKVY